MKRYSESWWEIREQKKRVLSESKKSHSDADVNRFNRWNRKELDAAKLWSTEWRKMGIPLGSVWNDPRMQPYVRECDVANLRKREIM